MSETILHRTQAPEIAGTLLAIDTSMGTSVALGSGGRIIEVVSDDPRGHAEVVGSLIARVLEEFDVPPANVDAVVAGIGPGPFTGLRVGIAAARAFALGQGASVLSLVSHDAIALSRLSRAGERLRVIQDAKRRELFVTEYDGFDAAGVPVRTVDPHLIAAVDYVEGALDLRPLRVSASDLLRLAARKLAVGQAFDPDRALYLRLPDVLESAAPKRVTP